MKQFIPNRHGLKISVLVEIPENPKGLAFVMHGLAAYKEQPQMEIMAKVFIDRGYVTIRFDATHSTGESDGTPEQCSPTTYYEDLEDVIKWASIQDWYREKFVLLGNSLGGLCVGTFAEEYPEKIQALVLQSSVISGKEKLESDTRKGEESMEQWEKTGWKIRESKSRPGLVIKIPWSFRLDSLRYDLKRTMEKLTMPVLLIVGEKDTHTTPESIRSFYENLATQKELHEIPGAGHTLYEEKHRRQCAEILKKWLSESIVQEFILPRSS